MEKWEYWYAVITLDTYRTVYSLGEKQAAAIMPLLNDFGQQGWELVSMHEQPGTGGKLYYECLFKRRTL